MAFTVTSGPSTSSSTSATPAREASWARDTACTSSSRLVTRDSPRWPCRSGAFTTAGTPTRSIGSPRPIARQAGGGRARGRRRAGPAARAPRLGRGELRLRALDRPPPGLVLAVPGDGAREAFLERRARRPAAQAPDLLRRADMPVDLTRPLLDVL